MKIQCSVCEMAEATVLCCADEAALCWSCDEKIHAANKLASKHQRVLLSTSASQIPKCDICQETVGFFFCLEDRALLCRKCDVAIHTVNKLVSSHQRFLLTGVKVGNDAVELGQPPSSMKSNTTNNIVPLASTCQPIEAADFAPPSLPFVGDSSASGDGIQQWQFDEFLGLTDLNQNYDYIDNVSSKADSGKLNGFELDEGLVEVPDVSWAVPQIYSPPTVSGLCLPKSHEFETPAFVPDVCYSSMQHLYQQTTTSLKRRRQF